MKINIGCSPNHYYYDVIVTSVFSLWQKRTKRTFSRHHAPDVIESHYQRYCITLYCITLSCLFHSLYLPLISITIFLFHFFFYLSPTPVCSLCLPPFCDWGRDSPKSESRWATMTDIISPKQITTLRIHSRPPLAPAKPKLCSPCQIESSKNK